MSVQKQYKRPPLVEAVLAIQLNDASVTLSQVEKCGGRVKLEYPTKKPLHFQTSQIEWGARSSASTTSKQVGFSWTSIDEKRIFQAKLDGFTFSQLEPYTTWQDFNTEAEKLWEVYKKATHSKQKFARVGLRYINKIDIPSDSVDLRKYFNVYPHIPDLLPQNLNSFFFQTSLVLADASAVVNIVQTHIQSPPATLNTTSILLDIDIYRTESIPYGNDFWGVFEVLAQQKNRVFESCITQSTRDLFGGEV